MCPCWQVPIARIDQVFFERLGRPNDIADMRTRAVFVRPKMYRGMVARWGGRSAFGALLHPKCMVRMSRS